jgi:hypothetical protein
MDEPEVVPDALFELENDFDDVPKFQSLHGFNLFWQGRRELNDIGFQNTKGQSNHSNIGMKKFTLFFMRFYGCPSPPAAP